MLLFALKLSCIRGEGGWGSYGAGRNSIAGRGGWDTTSIKETHLGVVGVSRQKGKALQQIINCHSQNHSTFLIHKHNLKSQPVDTSETEGSLVSLKVVII